jgi:hypothetical protein
MGGDVDGTDMFEYSGASVDLSADGETLAVGAHADGTNKGHVRVFTWDGADWTQKGADILGEEMYDYSGVSINMAGDGNTVAIGAFKNDGGGVGAGHVRVFTWNGSMWTQKGKDIDGEEVFDGSGVSVEISDDGSIVAVGAHENSNGEMHYHAGHVRVFQWRAGAWRQMGHDINGEAESDYSGSSIDLSADGKTIAVGAYLNDGGMDCHPIEMSIQAHHMLVEAAVAGHNYYKAHQLEEQIHKLEEKLDACYAGGRKNDAGHVRVYTWSARWSAWVQLGKDIDGEAAYDNAGVSVNLNGDGTILAIGAWGHDEDDMMNVGHARIFKWTGSEWTQHGQEIVGEAAWDHSGSSVDLSRDGTIISVGAVNNDGNGRNSGHVRVFSTCDHLSNPEASSHPCDTGANMCAPAAKCEPLTGALVHEYTCTCPKNSVETAAHDPLDNLSQQVCKSTRKDCTQIMDDKSIHHGAVAATGINSHVQRFVAADTNACAKACEDHKSCAGWTYKDEKGESGKGHKRCWLLDSSRVGYVPKEWAAFKSGKCRDVLA